MMELLKKTFPKMWMKDGEDFNHALNGQIWTGENSYDNDGLPMFDYWSDREQGDESFCDTIKRVYGEERCFSNKYLYSEMVPMTYTSNSDVIFLFDEYRKPNKFESCCIGSFPMDYNFVGLPYNYMIGMSVPPVMTAQIATRIYEQVLK